MIQTDFASAVFGLEKADAQRLLDVPSEKGHSDSHSSPKIAISLSVMDIEKWRLKPLMRQAIHNQRFTSSLCT